MSGSVMPEGRFFETVYGELQSASACGRYVAVSHRALERGVGPLPDTARLLELGGNLGEHCPYVRHPYAEYVVTDHRAVDLQPINERVRFEVADAHDLPYEDDTFDRVLVTCVLHHLDDPELALREMRRVVKPGGWVSILLPCDPGLAYRLAKALGPYRSLRQRPEMDGIDPRYFHYLQHRNHYPGLAALIAHVFERDRVRRRWWPWRVPSWNANLFTVFQVGVAVEPAGKVDPDPVAGNV